MTDWQESVVTVPDLSFSIQLAMILCILVAFNVIYKLKQNFYYIDVFTKGGINKSIVARYCISVLFFLEMMEKIINFFKRALQISKRDVKPLEVAKACVGPKANKSSVNKYLDPLHRAEIISKTFFKITKDSQSDPRYNALPVIEEITGTFLKLKILLTFFKKIMCRS